MQVNNALQGSKLGSANVPDVPHQFDALPDSALVRLPTMVMLFGVSRATIWRWVKQGVLPAPKHPSVRVAGWLVGEVRTYMENMK